MTHARLPDGSLVSYQVSGEGFPLVLMPGPDGMAVWLPHMPLLGELCRAVAYEGCPPQPAVETLPALLEHLRLERVYLASPLPVWAPALEFACLHTKVLEALLLVELPGAEAEVKLPRTALAPQLAALTLPTFILLSNDRGPAQNTAGFLSDRLPHCRIDTLARFARSRPDLPSTPRRQFPHLMMTYLLNRERHRNLVQGASFLL